jgi:putative transposase
MSRYVRLRRPGGSWFFTVCLARRGSDLTDHIDDLREAYARTHSELPVRTEAIVILPDHLHAIWTLPEGDTDFSERWRRIKARFSHAVGERDRSASKWRQRERGLWQRRFWEHAIRDEADFDAHVRYVWANPVKHGLVERPSEWALSSIHRDIREGRVDPEWAGTTPDGDFGE